MYIRRYSGVFTLYTVVIGRTKSRHDLPFPEIAEAILVV